MMLSNVSTGKIIIKVPLLFAFLILLVWSGAGCRTMKAERNLADLEEKETEVGDNIEREQQKVDQVSKEIEQLKKDAGK
jgi:hypothetical protein